MRVTQYWKKKEEWPLILSCIIAILACSTYWLAVMFCQSEPFSVSVMYRHLDWGNFAVITNSFRRHLGEFQIFEKENSGFLHFPLAAYLPHVIFYNIFGSLGFPVSDIFIHILRLTLILMIFSRVEGSALSRFIACLVFLAGSENVLFQHINVAQIPGFWSYRIPRDFVTGVFFLSFIWHWMRFQEEEKGAVGLGISLGLIVNSDFYLSITVLTFIFVQFAYDISRQLFKKWLPVFGSILPFGLLFVVQTQSAAPDLKARLGQYKYLGPTIVVSHIDRAIFLVCLIILLLALLGGNFRQEIRRTRSLLLVRTLTLLTLISCFSSFLFTGITNLGIQEYHFAICTRALFGALLFIGISNYICSWIPKVRLLRTIGISFVSIGILCVAWAHASFNIRRAQFGGELLVSMDPSSSTDRSRYRNSFSQLVEFLTANDSSQRKVLGTFSLPVAKWWNTFGRGYLYVPDSEWTTAENVEIEERFITLAKQMGMSAAGVKGLLQNPTVQANFFLADYYQANHFFRRYPSSSYTTEQLSSIDRYYDNWGVVIPTTEVNRILSAFGRQSKELNSGRLDFIIVDRIQTPNYQIRDFVPVFTNDDFVVLDSKNNVRRNSDDSLE